MIKLLQQPIGFIQKKKKCFNCFIYIYVKQKLYVYLPHSEQTSLSFDSVKQTKVESSLVSPAVMRKSAVSTDIHEEGLSEEQKIDFFFKYFF